MPEAPLTGSIWLLWLYDVCEEINLDALRAILGVEVCRKPSFRHHLSPEYVRFERPPVVQLIEPIIVEGDRQVEGELNYYEYGVISVKLELPFTADWQHLTELSHRWMTAPEVEAQAVQTVRRHLKKVQAALVKPREDWLTEDYTIIHLKDTVDSLSAAELIAQHGKEIARIVRGERAELSPEETTEILGSRLSYYPDDLLVVGWTAAFIQDTAEDAAPTIQLLEYANTQLLEFRYYDAVLSQLLQGVYRSLEKKGNFLKRWRMASQAEHLNTIRLDIRELTERVDTAIKFLSDMFSARLYRLAAAKVGVEDYRRLVDGKLHTAGELYEFMMDQFHQSRGFLLELVVVIILIIELVFLFRGKG